MSLEILSVSSDSRALMVAVRGTSHRIAISPTKPFFFISATRDLAALVVVDQHVGDTAQDDVHGIALVALVEQLLAGIERHPLAGEGDQLELGRLHLGEDRHAFENFDFLVEVHRTLLGYLTLKP